MENLGEQTVQLRERHWKIFASDGFLETVRGRGVVGQEPVLSTRQPAFQGLVASLLSFCQLLPFELHLCTEWTLNSYNFNIFE